MPTKKVAKSAAKKKTTKKVAKSAVYVATLRALGQSAEGKGASPAEAIAAIKFARPPRVRGILEVIGPDGRAQMRILMPYSMQRLFAPSPTLRSFQLKQVASLFV